jgi:hypothetical protein
MPSRVSSTRNLARTNTRHSNPESTAKAVPRPLQLQSFRRSIPFAPHNFPKRVGPRTLGERRAPVRYVTMPFSINGQARPGKQLLKTGSSMQNLTRRDFLYASGISTAMLMTERWARGLAAPKPSDKLTVGCIGVGSQGLRVTLDLLRMPEVQVVAVCDVNRQSSDYLDWGPDELRDKVRLLLQQPAWGRSLAGPTAGREVAQSIVNTFYANNRGKSNYHGCASYEDFRELLAKEKDLDAVVVSTPDHWHALIAIAAMRAGKHVYSQKPMAHTVWEARQMAKVAKETGCATQVSIFNSRHGSQRRSWVGASGGHLDHASIGILEARAEDTHHRGSGAGGIELGHVARTCALSSLQPRVPPLRMAGVVRLWLRSHRRYGRVRF